MTTDQFKYDLEGMAEVNPANDELQALWEAAKPLTPQGVKRLVNNLRDPDGAIMRIGDKRLGEGWLEEAGTLPPGSEERVIRLVLPDYLKDPRMQKFRDAMVTSFDDMVSMKEDVKTYLLRDGNLEVRVSEPIQRQVFDKWSGGTVAEYSKYWDDNTPEYRDYVMRNLQDALKRNTVTGGDATHILDAFDEIPLSKRMELMKILMKPRDYLREHMDELYTDDWVVAGGEIHGGETVLQMDLPKPFMEKDVFKKLREWMFEDFSKHLDEITEGNGYLEFLRNGKVEVRINE